ncbi:Pycsar phage resistance system uridylate cyclase PycC [Stenotrophomonas nitritireducens]|uniref:Pycsar phage resistance system uridylate cyclase PycC n=1 Tax=Stenotrophomonas nitritireducens TaxID=83617 RepID=UPI003D96FFDE
MGLKDELTTFCHDVFHSKWETTEGRKVPDEDSKLTLKNTAITIEGTVLYADLDGSTAMVDGYKNWFAAEIYKTYLYCCARIIAAQDGVVTAYDGDRVMAVFIGDSKNTNAVKAALKIKWAVDQIIMPKLKARGYANCNFDLKHVTGIDTCSLFVAKTGARGANDLVWVGRAANYAAKLTSMPSSYTYITASVYNKLADEAKFTNGKSMWETVKWDKFNNDTIYRSSWHWSFV